jgi:competence protein ComGC
MNNKAFTLVELLAVIVLLMVIFLLVSPAITSVISQSEDTIYNTQINTILKSAYDYTLKNTNSLPSIGNKSYITLGELKTVGLIDANIIDPSTSKLFPDNLVISISYVSTNSSYDKSIAMLEGNYLYKVEYDKLENKSLLPTINLSGINKNSNGDYIIVLDLNDNFNNINFTAHSYDNVDLTSRVKYYITSSNEVVNSINTSKSGIYKIYYSVVDDEGYANSIILNVIVADNTAPSLELPKTNTISEQVSSMNLLDGVSCTDNSGFCDISTSGTINYGTKGKYIITYTVTDPSGNTTTAERVITVE